MLADTPSVSLLLHDVARLIRVRFDARARSLGVTRPQWRALFHLHRDPGLTQSELADRVEVERITLCRMIDRLAEAGMVERRADPSDRRVWRLHLLPAADAVVGRLTEIGRALEAETMAVLSPQEGAQLVDKLERLRTGLRDADDSRRKDVA